MSASSDKEMQDRLDTLGAEERRALKGRAAEEERRDLAAYLLLYDALEEAPTGSLPEGFAARAARRAFARPRAASRQARASWLRELWLEALAPALLLVVVTAAAFLLVPGGVDMQSFRFSLDSFEALQQLWTQARLELMAAAGGVLFVLALLDRLGSSYIASRRSGVDA